MIVRLFLAAVLGGAIGCAELAARYRDKPFTAILLPSGLLYLLVNAAAALMALVAIEATGVNFGMPTGASPEGEYVIQVLAAGLGSGALFRTSFTLAQDRGAGLGPILLLRSMLNIVDSALERKRTLSRLSHNDLAGLSFAHDHAALAELCCHALQRFDLAEAQRLGELAADLWAREDLTDADKLDCFGLELCRLVGERTLRKAADRLRDRPRPGEESHESGFEGEVSKEGRRPLLGPRPGAAAERPTHESSSSGESRESMLSSSRFGDSVPSVTGRLTRRSFRDS